MKNIYLLLLTVFSLTFHSIAQPGAVGTNNLNGAPFTCTALTAPSGLFFQARIQATQSSSSVTWEFPATCGYPGDVWRPYFGGSTAVAFNSTLAPNGPGNTGALYNSGNGGVAGSVAATTTGRYYTFNVENVLPPLDAKMAVLETSYNPVTISSVSNTTPANLTNAVLVTCSTSAALSSGEYVYVRYSTDNTFASSSAISQFYFSGTTGQALIPCQAAGPVYYYVFSSNRTAAQITADVVANGRIAYDMLTLNLNNNGGLNYTYTQGSGTNFGGIYSVPSSCYASISTFVTALNGGTITAPVTCYAIGGSPTETATTGGIAITATGTIANPIIFQKFGSGSYTIQSSASLVSGRLYDGIIKLIGADYVTIDGFTLQENPANTTTAAGTNNMTEWGIALLHASASDGAQNNSILNNTISLNRTYTNTFGIYSNVLHDPTAITVNNDITNNTSAPNNGNKIYGNTISNVNMGITFIGSAVSANQDVGNDIGGSSPATGNVITNWGGAAATSGYLSNSSTSYCILMNHQTADNISYNTITSAAISGAATSFTGIMKNYSTTAPTGTFTSSITYNTITMSSGFTSGLFRPISSAGMSTLSSATISIDHNNILNCVMSGVSSTSAFTGIVNSSSPGTLNITHNVIRGFSTTATNAATTGIDNSGAAVNNINITNNQIGNSSGGAFTFLASNFNNITGIINSGGTATTTINLNNNAIEGITGIVHGQVIGIRNFAPGLVVNMNFNTLGSATANFISFNSAIGSNLFGFLNNGGASGTNLVSISNNDIRGISYTSTVSAFHYYILNTYAGNLQNINDNTFTNITANTTGDIWFIETQGTMGATAVENCSNNRIVTGYNKTASGAGEQFKFYAGLGSAANGATMIQTGNDFSNVTVTGSTIVSGWYNHCIAATKTITGNTFSNITSGTGSINVMDIDISGTNSAVSSNVISNINSQGQVLGILYGSQNTQGTHTVSSNTISNLSSTGTGGNVAGIVADGTNIPTLNVNNNSISGLASSGASSSLRGIELDNGVGVNINNNVINNLLGTGGTSPLAEGIAILGGTTVGIGYNKLHTISETGAISTTADAINGISIYAGKTVNLYNNFIANVNAPNASLTDAIRAVNINSSTTNAAYNCFYNSIYMNAVSTGTNFGTSGIYHITNATSTTAALNMVDNIIVNTSAANGTGITAAYRRSDATLNNYAPSSDYNLFYAGTPSATGLIYYDGTNSDQTLAAYQARVGSRDANSISVMPNFTSATDLHLTATNNCTIEGAGTPIGGYTTDIDAQTRDAATPDIGADEFTAIFGTTLAGVAGSAVCSNKNVAPSGTTYATNSCDLIAKLIPSGGAAIGGKVNVCVTLDATQQYHNAEPYVQRHFDIEPVSSNTSTTSATVTLYFTDAEFVNYNTNNPVWPKLPTVAGGGNGDANRANLKVTQYHGTATTSPSTPGNYTGGVSGIYIDPDDSNILWNGSYWTVTFDITGFSGFYVHTNPKFALPISLDYLNGVKQGDKHLLNWKVTCNTTPRATLILERSTDSRNFTGIYSITADALRCQQPFNYLDAQPFTGMNYYRLKIVDADGKITYSNTIALLNATKGFALMNIAPDPVTGNTCKLNVTAANSLKMDLVISDMLGRLMKRQTLMLTAGYNSYDINVSNLAPGTYNIYGIAADERSGLIRFVKR